MTLWLIGHFLSILSLLLALALIAQILKQRRAPGVTLAWLISIVIVPYVAIPFYLLFGNRKLAPRNKTKPRTDAPLLTHDPIEAILNGLGSPAAQAGNSALLLEDPETAYHQILKSIESAKKEIRVEFFILKEDLTGHAVLEALKQKASQGIQIKILLDGLGSFWLHRVTIRELRKSGIGVSFFKPIIHIPFRGRTNLRNHRKQLLIDHQSAIIGGMNIAEEYLGPLKNSKPKWADLAAFVEGAVVRDLIEVFETDWSFATKTELCLPVFDTKAVGQELLQAIPSGPDSEQDPLYDAMLSGFFSAKQRIWIATPYFIPDESLTRALEMAARRQVDVRIIVPKISNHFLADLGRRSYLSQLAQAGCKVWFFEPGMMHTKLLIIDETDALMGSANLDMRSLFLNYEVGLMFYSKPEVIQFAAHFEKLLTHAVQVDLSKNPRIGILDGLGRILSPLL